MLVYFSTIVNIIFSWKEDFCESTRPNNKKSLKYLIYHMLGPVLSAFHRVISQGNIIIKIYFTPFMNKNGGIEYLYDITIENTKE